MRTEPHRTLVILIGGGLAALFLAIVVVVALSLTGSGSAAEPVHARVIPGLPPYWTVRRGDTYAVIAQKTGLTIDELETFNRYVDPSSIVPGQRLKLRLHPPKPKPKPLGPRAYHVRAGDTYGSIARRFGHTVSSLQRLNPKHSAADLQPGDRLRLR
ncbi:MAG TPA: LysM peptidoglycan-binding domain-containing protein [Solirubrobacteraceae bacterium]|jgi:LysM repeat protein|nr:LysM peptidoglycan-binding domain-containing protein [Solirubrobacteraceae bacterium]